MQTRDAYRFEEMNNGKGKGKKKRVCSDEAEQHGEIASFFSLFLSFFLLDFFLPFLRFSISSFLPFLHSDDSRWSVRLNCVLVSIPVFLFSLHLRGLTKVPILPVIGITKSERERRVSSHRRVGRRRPKKCIIIQGTENCRALWETWDCDTKTNDEETKRAEEER